MFATTRITLLVLSLIVLGSLAGCGIKPIKPDREIPTQPLLAEATWEELSAIPLKDRSFCVGRVVYYDGEQLKKLIDERGYWGKLRFTSDFPKLQNPTPETTASFEIWTNSFTSLLLKRGYKVAPCGDGVVVAEASFAQYIKGDRMEVVVMSSVNLSYKGKLFLVGRNDFWARGQRADRAKKKLGPVTREEINIIVTDSTALTIDDMEQVWEIQKRNRQKKPAAK